MRVERASVDDVRDRLSQLHGASSRPTEEVAKRPAIEEYEERLRAEAQAKEELKRKRKEDEAEKKKRQRAEAEAAALEDEGDDNANIAAIMGFKSFGGSKR